MPFLHAHRRRVPAHDVDRRVVIGIGAEKRPAAFSDGDPPMLKLRPGCRGRCSTNSPNDPADRSEAYEHHRPTRRLGNRGEWSDGHDRRYGSD